MTEPVGPPPQTVNVTDPLTGAPKAIPEAALGRAREQGSRPLTDEELNAFIKQRDINRDIKSQLEARAVGVGRGFGEAFGLPTDQLAVSAGGLVGKREETRGFLNKLKEEHPYESTYGDLVGQASGFVTGGELLGGELATSKAASVGGRILKGSLETGVRGGLENTIAGSASDMNEAALGDHKINGQKLLASAPEHLLWGFGPGAVIGGAGATLGEVGGAIARKGAPALDRGASSLVGREAGFHGAEASRVGGEVREGLGRVPSSSGEIADFYGGKQNAFREATEASRQADIAAMGERHAAEGAGLEASTMADTAKSRSMVRDGIAGVEDRHAVALDALNQERNKAVDLAEQIGKEKLENERQLKTLASRLDDVSGADRPKTSAIDVARTNATNANLYTGEMTPRTQQALGELDKWQKGFARAFPDGEVPFTKMQAVAAQLDGMAAKAGDAQAKSIISSMADAARTEFDRASEVTASFAGEGTSLHAERLRELAPQLAAAHEKALADVASHSQVIADAEQQAAKEIALAKQWGKIATGDAEQEAAAALKAQKGTQKAEAKAVPKATDETPFDKTVETIAAKANAAPEPLISKSAALGAILSLAHGNPAVAAASLGGSLAAGLARGKGNLFGAKVMAGLADTLREFDSNLQRGAKSAIGTISRETALSTSRQQPVEDSGSRLSFERVSKQVTLNQADPNRIESRVRASMGNLVQIAPNTYSSTLEAAQRAQTFLQMAIPPTRQDKFSPTAHLEPSDVSDAEKYDYMQYVAAIRNPVEILRGVKTGAITDRQVAAVKYVYPDIFDQMGAEVDRELSDLQRPINYDRAIALGTLLGKPTTEAMDPSFQRAQAAMFAGRVKAEKINTGGAGRPPAGPNGKMSKATMSGSEQVESGEGY